MKTVNEQISVELYRNARCGNILEYVVRRLLKALPTADFIELRAVDMQLDQEQHPEWDACKR